MCSGRAVRGSVDVALGRDGRVVDVTSRLHCVCVRVCTCALELTRSALGTHFRSHACSSGLWALGTGDPQNLLVTAGLYSWTDVVPFPPACSPHPPFLLCPLALAFSFGPRVQGVPYSLSVSPSALFPSAQCPKHPRTASHVSGFPPSLWPNDASSSLYSHTRLSHLLCPLTH